MSKLRGIFKRRERWFEVSLVAFAAGWAGCASASCSGSNPVNCTGVTTGEIALSTSNTVNLVEGAVLSSSAADDAALRVNSSAPIGTGVVLNIAGTISSMAAGIEGNATGLSYGGANPVLYINVSATGEIDGVPAIYLQSTGGGGSRAGAVLDNSGKILSASKAIVVSNSAYAGFSSLTNEAGGVIRGAGGAISAPVGKLTNAGLIDGGSGAAYTYPTGASVNFYVIPSSLTNIGVMISSSVDGTISLPLYLSGGNFQIINSGAIEDVSGPAIKADNYVSINNTAGGVVKSDGGYAVIASGGANIVNTGAIYGSLLVGSSANTGSALNNTNGNIYGNVAFGNGNNTLTVRWDSAADQIAGISGTVVGGSGDNTLFLDITGSTTLDKILKDVVVPANFQTLGIVLDGGVTGSLNGDAPDGLVIDGAGTFISNGQVSSVGTAFSQSAYQVLLGQPVVTPPLLGFINNGNVVSQFSPKGGNFAINLTAAGSFFNSGTISSIGGSGVSVQLGFLGESAGDVDTFTNNGKIVADATAVSLTTTATNATYTGANSGLIQSNNGVGLILGGSMTNTGSIFGGTIGVDVAYGTFSNSGKITGALGADFDGVVSNSGTVSGVTTGVRLDGGTLSNSGAITATSGPGLLIYYGSVTNQAGGVIAGASDAIDDNGGGAVVNEGTLNGNVKYTGPSSDVFVDKGGVVNGNLTFGNGNDIYVTDVSKYVDGRFANISGTLSGGGGVNTIVLQVDSDASASLASAPNFQQIEYDLKYSANLTLISGSVPTTTLALAGTGNVDLWVDASVTNAPGLIVTTPYGVSTNTPEALSVVSHGNLSFANTGGNSSAGILLRNNTTFENDGSITVSSQGLTSPSAAAISGGAIVTNTGTIAVGNATAVLNAQSVVNRGTIVQGVNAQAAYGLYGVNSVVNSGSIITGNTAVTLNYGNTGQPIQAPSVVNSGTIRSTGGDAIDEQYTTTPVSINNTSTGEIISDAGYAIYGNGSAISIENAGTIHGDISLSGGDDVIGNNGQITGNINMGNGNDTFILTGGSFTGTATAAPGGYNRLILNVADSNAGTLALGQSFYVGFSELDVQAGVATLSGSYNFGIVRVNGGSLIGLSGSRLQAQSITVAPGALFGSAGTVFGDIAVSGTLSPLAAKGDMSVLGNVSMAQSAVAQFALTANAAYQLQVSGKLTIASGANLQLTGAGRLAPGQRVNLIYAAGGITGSFSTVSGEHTNLFLVQSAQALQGLELFSTSSAFPAQVSGVVSVLNTALINGEVGKSLVDALPALVYPSSGETDPNAIARLTPQAYASASQLPIEGALSVISATRQEAHFAVGQPGSFAFNEVISGGRKLTGDPGSGVDLARVLDSGDLTGLGYGTKSAWVAAFFGYLNGFERIPGLDARTTARSFVTGAQSQFRFGKFRLGLMGAFDRSDADTERSAPADTTMRSHYTFKSSVLDLTFAYRAELGEDWAIVPQLATSYVQTTRDSLAEQGSGPFALTVQGNRSTHCFVDGHIEVQGGLREGQTLHPFASVGFITRSGGISSATTASLNGLSVPLSGVGVDLNGARATVAGGVRYQFSSKGTTSVGYESEFGNNGSQRLQFGLQLVF